MSTTTNSTNEKQIVFRVSEQVHRQIRIKAAEEGTLSPNQYSKEKLLEALGLSEDELKKSS